MKKTQKKQINRFFWSEKPKALPLTEQQREERVKRILHDAAEGAEARRREKVMKALLKKAAELKKARAPKKVMAKKIPKERNLVRREAERYIDNELKKLCPSGSLIDRLRVAATQARNGRCSSTVLEVLLERIRRNQWDKLSPENQGLVVQAEALLGKQTN